MDTKFFLKSKTIAGLVIKCIGMALLIYGYNNEAVAAITEGLDKVVGFGLEGIGAALIVYGRFQANKPLTLKVGKTNV
jgi:hypothetical protein